MTTIACNLSEMAGDRQVVDDHIGEYKTTKIEKIGDSIFGICGDNCPDDVFQWLREAVNSEVPWHKAKRPKHAKKWSYFLIQLAPDGIWLWNQKLYRTKVEEPCYAVGSGRKVALYCMRHLNMNPKESVEQACLIDHWSNGPVDVLKLRE